MNTIKRSILLTLCAATVCTGMSACAKKGPSSSFSESSSKSEDNSELQKQVDELNGKVEKLSGILTEYFGEDISNIDMNDINGEIHNIYDDSAVVEAYKTGDDSKLSDEKDKYILKELKKAISEIITDDMDDFDKEKAVYDYVFSKTHFNENSLAAIPNTNEDYSHTPYGFFHDHSTICVGNATTFKLFFDVLGIDSKIIHSTQNGEHAWNVVKIDGSWYHLDLTFDNGTDYPDYAYFNVPDSVKNDGTYPWDESEYPACNDTDKCMICLDAEKLDSVYDIPQKIKNIIDTEKPTAYLSIAIPDGCDTDEVKGQLENIINSIYFEEYYSAATPVVITSDEKNACFGISVYTMSDEDYGNYEISENVLDIDYDKLQAAFADALGDEMVYSDGIGYYTDY